MPRESFLRKREKGPKHGRTALSRRAFASIRSYRGAEMDWQRALLWYNQCYFLMKRTKKQWIKPMLKTLPIFFECTCYSGAV